MVVGLRQALERLPSYCRGSAARAFEGLFDDEPDSWFDPPLEVWFRGRAGGGRRKALLLVGHAPPFIFNLYLVCDRARIPAMVVGPICTNPESWCVC